MLQFTGFADDGGLAVTLRLRRGDTQRLNALLAQQRAQLFADGARLSLSNSFRPPLP